ncbi:MAG: P-II family nitrogen regulator [Fibrobacter sp.]|jgi:nitrogen regulatory protein PII|nr:P-II family nitrogen regulator [Fibrobacter sp.]
MSGFNHEVIFCIVNTGFSETVMEAAKDAGARGGTILNARGTANKEAESFFHIAVQPEKEIVMILVDAKIKDAVLHALYQKAGLDTMGQGIAFSLPVDNVVGLTPWKAEIKAAEAAAEKAAEKAESAIESAEKKAN